MILYHGSNVIIKQPDTIHSRKNLDFGQGFYATSIRSQAEKWIERFIRLGDKGFINIFEFDEKALQKCRVLNFDMYSEEWLDFITNCRMGKDRQDIDLVIGGVANDRVFNTCELYFKQLIDKDTALKRLKYEKPNHQICFKNQETINEYLHFLGSEQR